MQAEVFCEIAIFAIVIDHHDRLFFVALLFELILTGAGLLKAEGMAITNAACCSAKGLCNQKDEFLKLHYFTFYTLCSSMCHAILF